MSLLLASAIGAGLAAISLLYFWRRERGKTQALEQQLQVTRQDMQRLQEACARLAPGDVADRLVGSDVESAAERRQATALFADIVGYTAISEQLEPDQLARVLNGYFQAMSEAITAHRGQVSTFIGDGILAYFGVLEPNPWQCDDAVRAALAMRQALLEYNRQLKSEDLPEMAIGVGLHYGPGLAGMVGSTERMEYAFVGRTVNLAARVESLTRTHGVDILITEAVRENLDPQVQIQAMPAAEVKGIAEPVVTFAVIDWPEENPVT